MHVYVSHLTIFQSIYPPLYLSLFVSLCFCLSIYLSSHLSIYGIMYVCTFDICIAMTRYWSNQAGPADGHKKWGEGMVRTVNMYMYLYIIHISYRHTTYLDLFALHISYIFVSCYARLRIEAPDCYRPVSNWRNGRVGARCSWSRCSWALA